MDTKTHGCGPDCMHDTGRRAWLKAAGAGVGVAMLAATTGLHAADGRTASLTQAQRDALTPDQVIELMKRGNERFRSGKPSQHDFRGQQHSSAAGQYPGAALLSCIDSRAPAEIVFDLGIGDIFNARIAGNTINRDLAGSLEFACAVAGAKVVVVMGHTACGAIKGAIDGVELGNLTGLLNIIRPAIAATAYSGDRSGKNAGFVDAVAATNVRKTIEALRGISPVLADLEKQGRIKVVGAMYDLASGEVKFLA